MVDHFLTIESVQVESLSGGDGQIYGEIVVQNCGRGGVKNVYRRTITKPETKLAGDFLSLTGAPLGDLCDKWLIRFSLYDGDDHHDVAVGEIYMDIVPSSFVYDTSLHRTITGQYGAVSVRYNYLCRGVLAKIEVALIEEAREEAHEVARVFGTVTACQYFGEEEGWSEVTLFGKSAGEGAAVLPGGVVPMDRCLVAVPTWSNICVEVELSRAGGGIGGDELWASGSVYFDKEEGVGHASKKIGGGGGRKVRVSIHILAE